MSKRTLFWLSLAVVLSISLNSQAQSSLTAKNTTLPPQPSTAAPESDRSRDGLTGPVRRVRTEIVKLSNQGGRMMEGKRSLLEIVSYDIKGNKVENQYYPVQGATLTGKEVYKYDEKGNISEMTLMSDDGTLLGKEVYKYEFDFAGNWNKMTTSVAVIDTGRVVFEPSEVTYRSIMYYLDQNMANMFKPGYQPPTPANKVSASDSAPPPTKGNGAKSSPTLPTSDVSLEAIALNSAEVKTVAAASESNVPQVVLDSEPPPPAPRPILKPISGGVLNGSAVNLPAPLYPEGAKRMRVSGTVVVEVVIDETGKVISATASGGPQALRDAAVNAAMKARFSPTKLSGQPVKVAGVINYKFTLTS
jgi:protein TonB